MAYLQDEDLIRRKNSVPNASETRAEVRRPEVYLYDKPKRFSQPADRQAASQDEAVPDTRSAAARRGTDGQSESSAVKSTAQAAPEKQRREPSPNRYLCAQLAVCLFIGATFFFCSRQGGALWAGMKADLNRLLTEGISLSSAQEEVTRLAALVSDLLAQQGPL